MTALCARRCFQPVDEAGNVCMVSMVHDVDDVICTVVNNGAM